MLSLTQLLYHLFHHTPIAVEAVKALTDAIHHIKMDELFKENYTFFAFLRLDDIEPVYQRQVHDLPELWSQLDNVIERDQFFVSFSMDCEQLNLPAEEYDMDAAFHKAQSEWAQELMVSTANYILKWNEDKHITTQVASWQNGQICVDTSVCNKYRDWLNCN